MDDIRALNLKHPDKLFAADIVSSFNKNLKYSAFVENPQWRSQTVIVAEVPNGSGEVLKKLAGKGLIVGAGYGEFKDKHIRIGNFPMHTIRDVKKVIRVLR